MSTPQNYGGTVRGARWWAAVIVLLAAACMTLLPRPEAALSAPHLQALPLEIDGWSSADIPIEPRLVKASGADNYLNRVYSGADGEAGLYVGYFRSQRAGDSVHSPKNCLPGGGWQAVRAGRAWLPTADGRASAVNLYLVENAGQRVVVLYWYQSHGELTASEYAAKWHTMRDAILLRRSDSALVRIAVPVTGGEEQATARALHFAQSLAPALQDALPR